jgi:hypothetical protein
MSLLVLDVLERALRLNGSLAAGNTPGADDLTDGMTALNTMKRAMFGTLIGARLTAQMTTGGSAQAENGGEYLIAGGVAFTLTAPGSPRAGTRFGAVDMGQGFGTQSLTVGPGAALIEGVSPLVISANGDNRRWWFRSDQGAWVREADFTDPSNAIEFPDGLISYLPYMLALTLAGEFNTELRADIIAANAEGRTAFARAYAPRGLNLVEPPLGASPTRQAPQQAPG